MARATRFLESTFRIGRRLPGSLERVRVRLTDSELRKLWLASGVIRLKVAAPFELVWRSDRLLDDMGRRPVDFGEKRRLARISGYAGGTADPAASEIAGAR